MRNYYAVTTDSGRSWSIWDAQKDLSYRQHNVWPYIKDVHIEPDGSGSMTLPPRVDDGARVPALYTNDYGRTWSVE
jgi:hypothetical protein